MSQAFFVEPATHADELGGQLTSLIQAANTHALVHDVLVDVTGRDTVRDFLAKDGDVLRVYESDSVDTAVTNQSAFASYALSGTSGSDVVHKLTTLVTAGLMYVQLSDPYTGQKIIKDVLRSDGKRLSPNNFWLSRTQDKQTHQWSHFVNFFDSNSTGSYQVTMGDPVLGPRPPVLQFIPNRTTYEGKQVGFLVEASDPDGTIPTVTAAPLPVGAVFNDNGNGTAVFNWTPAIGQAGNYIITYTASDGVLKATRSASIKVNPAWDTDGDGMDDAWEIQHFGNLDRDGTGDADGDGISDLQEFLNGTNPNLQPGPGIPTLKAPGYGTEATTQTPQLEVYNGVHEPSPPVTYQFEVYCQVN